MTVDEVIKEIEKDTLFYDESKGGVTFSGGEPLMQPDFLVNLLRSSKALGIHTAVDTCGYAPHDVLLTVSQYTDLFLYDVKVIDDEIHKKVTGVSNKVILHNLKELIRKKKKVIVRIPLIPGVNDTEKDLLEIGEVIASFHAQDVSVLPYHTAGVEKAHRLRMAAHAVDPPSDDTVDTAIQTLKKFKLNVTKGG
jgi:pyruvate formate lyase activating enzyme